MLEGIYKEYAQDTNIEVSQDIVAGEFLD